MPNVPAIQQFQMPNVANAAIQGLQLRGQRRQTQNAAVIQQQQLQLQQKAAERKNRMDVQGFALNLLSGVNSQEDADIAKGIFNSRYPQYMEKTEQIFANYNPEKIRLIRNSLRTETQRMKLEERETELEGFGAGTAIFRGGEQIGQVPFAPPTPPAPKFEVFEDEGGNQVYVEKGKPIPEGYSKVQARGTQVTIQTGDLGKATRSRLEGDIIEGTQNIQSFQKTRGLFKPEYLTLFGRGEKLIASAADKAGVSTKGQKRLIRERATWFRQAKADFIAYRKWATGVAGGEKELKEIATSFPDPVKNTPTQYQANLDSIEETTKRILSMNKDFLRSGIDLGQPLEKVLEQARRIGVGREVGVGRETGGEIIIRYDSEGNRLP